MWIVHIFLAFLLVPACALTESEAQAGATCSECSTEEEDVILLQKRGGQRDKSFKTHAKHDDEDRLGITIPKDLSMSSLKSYLESGGSQGRRIEIVSSHYQDDKHEFTGETDWVEAEVCQPAGDGNMKGLCRGKLAIDRLNPSVCEQYNSDEAGCKKKGNFVGVLMCNWTPGPFDLSKEFCFPGTTNMMLTDPCDAKNAMVAKRGWWCKRGTSEVVVLKDEMAKFKKNNKVGQAAQKPGSQAGVALLNPSYVFRCSFQPFKPK